MPKAVPGTTATSLQDFAASQSTKRDCAVCDLPTEIVEQIKTLRRVWNKRQGFSEVVIAWLASEGYEEASLAVDAHLRGRHWKR